jgi:tetratricopeptide (TPR) repeat protein
VRDSPEARIRLAHIDLRAGRFAAVHDRLAAVLAELPAETEPVLRARALIVLGSTAIRTDHFDDSERAFTEAVALLENRREPDVLGQSYMGRGVAYAAQGRYESALADFSRARIALELAGDGLALARVEANEGLLQATRNRYAEALPILRSAEQRFEKFGAINERVTLIAGEIDAELDLLDPAEALAASERAWPLVGRLQSARIQHALKLARARALAAGGRLTEARALLAELVREADPDTAKMPIARARAEQARLDFSAGEFATAAALANSAVAELTGTDDQDGSPTAKTYAALARAEQAWSQRQTDAAKSAYDDALREANENGAPVDLAEVVVSYAGTLIADGELERAGGVVGQVARWADRDFACALLQLRFYQALRQEDAWRAALTRAKALAGEREIPAALREFEVTPLAAAGH